MLLVVRARDLKVSDTCLRVGVPGHLLPSELVTRQLLTSNPHDRSSLHVVTVHL